MSNEILFLQLEKTIILPPEIWEYRKRYEALKFYNHMFSKLKHYYDLLDREARLDEALEFEVRSQFSTDFSSAIPEMFLK